MINTYFSNLYSKIPLIGSIKILPAISLEALTISLLLLSFITLLILEMYFPKKSWPFKKLAQSYYTNFNLFLFNNIVLLLLSISTVLNVMQRHFDHGLLSQISNPAWKIILSLVLLDLIAYLWHFSCHNIKYLWMFHKVHHSDPCLNVSTAFRMHIIELALFALIKVVLIIILGIDKTTALASEAITALFSMFHHANIGFSAEAQLGRLIIVPALHRVHHSIERIEHDRNFGAILSVWDRIFGTLTEGEPIAIGIKNNCLLGFFDQLIFGFTANAKSTNTLFFPKENVDSMIAIAAYYKAQHRQFSAGNEIDDWLEAEAEINKMM